MLLNHSYFTALLWSSINDSQVSKQSCRPRWVRAGNGPNGTKINGACFHPVQSKHPRWHWGHWARRNLPLYFLWVKGQSTAQKTEGTAWPCLPGSPIPLWYPKGYIPRTWQRQVHEMKTTSQKQTTKCSPSRDMASPLLLPKWPSTESSSLEMSIGEDPPSPQKELQGSSGQFLKENI